MEEMIVDKYHYLGDGIIRPDITIEEYLVKLLECRPLNREQMTLITGIPRTTLYDHLVKLIIDDRIEKFTSDGKRKTGRPKVYYRLLE